MTTDQLREGETRRSRRGTTWFASAPRIRDLAIVVKRFPSRSTGNGRNFLLVHGIGVSSRYYHPLAVILAQHGEVYLVDLPGYGAAPDPHQRVSIAEHAKVLGGFLDLGSIANPVIVGHSMGCQVVTQLVVDRPGTTDRLVLLAPSVDPAHRTFREQASRLLIDITRESVATNAIVGTDYIFRCGIPYFVNQLNPLLTDRIEDRLPHIAIPTLVVRGDRDPVVPRAWAESAARMLPYGTYAEVAGPHLIMRSDPERTARHIVEHIA